MKRLCMILMFAGPLFLNGSQATYQIPMSPPKPKEGCDQYYEKWRSLGGRTLYPNGDPITTHLAMTYLVCRERNREGK